MSKFILKLSKVSKDYDGIKALKGLSLQIEKNCIIGLVGPNGAGKTTLFNLITGLEQLTSGEIQIFDLTTNNLKS